LSTFIGKDGQSAIFQPDPAAFDASELDREKILAHNESIDTILDQLQDAIEDAKEAARLRKRSEEVQEVAMKAESMRRQS